MPWVPRHFEHAAKSVMVLLLVCNLSETFRGCGKRCEGCTSRPICGSYWSWSWGLAANFNGQTAPGGFRSLKNVCGATALGKPNCAPPCWRTCFWLLSSAVFGAPAEDKDLEDYSPADVAMALCRMVSYNIGQLAYLNAKRRP